MIASLGTAFGGSNLPMQMLQQRKQNDLATARIDAIKTATLLDLANARLSGVITAEEHEANLKLIQQRMETDEARELGLKGTERRAKNSAELERNLLREQISAATARGKASDASAKRSGTLSDLDIAKLPGVKAGSDAVQLELEQFRKDIPKIKREKEIVLRQQEIALNTAEMEDSLRQDLFSRIADSTDQGERDRLTEAFTTGKFPKIDVGSFDTVEKLMESLAARAIQKHPHTKWVGLTTYLKTGDMDEARVAVVESAFELADSLGEFDEFESAPAKVKLDFLSLTIRNSFERKDSSFIGGDAVTGKEVEGKLNQKKYLKSIREILKQDPSILKELQESGQWEEYIGGLAVWVPDINIEQVNRFLTTGAYLKHVPPLTGKAKKLEERVKFGSFLGGK